MRKKRNLFHKFICTKNLQEICANICPDLIEKSVPIIKKPAVGERQTPWKLAWRRITHWSYKIHLKNICNWILFLQNTYSLVFLLISNFSNGLHLHHFLIARLARSDPRNHFSVQKKTCCSIYSILAYFTMFSFRVLTCLKIVSIHIILNLNKFRQVWTCSDMFENPKNCNNQYHIESEQV